MPYANNQGVRIYYEVEGSGPAIVLAHGFLGDMNRWRSFGYCEALRNGFQVILFDARGHGRSDKPHASSDYGTKMVDDVLAVLDDAGVEKAHYFGYSMGAMIGFGAATRYPQRLLSLILGGSSPYPFEPDEKAREENAAAIKLLLGGPDGLIQMRERMLGRPLSPDERSALLTNDGEALAAVLSALPEPRLSDRELARITTPCLIYAGELDAAHAGAKQSAANLPRATFFSLPGLGHGPAFVRSDLILPHVKEFLAGVAEG